MYSIRPLLTLVALLTLGFALVAFSFMQMATWLEDTVVFECAGWKYTANTSGLNAIVVESSNLTWKGIPVSNQLLRGGFSIRTPIGDFSPLNGNWVPHYTEPEWSSADYSPPCKISTAFVDHRISMEKVVDQGFYQTPVYDVQISGTWDKCRLTGTPSSWVYISNQKGGFWIDPNRLEQIVASGDIK